MASRFQKKKGFMAIRNWVSGSSLTGGWSGSTFGRKKNVIGVMHMWLSEFSISPVRLLYLHTVRNTFGISFFKFKGSGSGGM